jgi:hypothetical protein
MLRLVAVLALIAAGAAVVLFFATGEDPLGAVLFRWNAGFLNAFQAGVQRYLAPWLWDSAVLPVLEQPAWLPLAVLALLISLPLGLFRRRM